MSDVGPGGETEPVPTTPDGAPEEVPPTTDPTAPEEAAPPTTDGATPDGEQEEGKPSGGEPPTGGSTDEEPPADAPTTTGPPAAGGGRILSDRDIVVALPPGWEGEIYRRAPEPVVHGDRVPRARRLQPTTRSIAHLGSFPLPPDRGDYGSGAVEIMRDEDILVVLFEFEPSSATEVMFAHSGIPHPLRASDFDPNQMQRPLPGMAGVQRFFNVGRQRSFCLYVVIGSYRRRKELVDRVNQVLASIQITAPLHPELR